MPKQAAHSPSPRASPDRFTQRRQRRCRKTSVVQSRRGADDERPWFNGCAPSVPAPPTRRGRGAAAGCDGPRRLAGWGREGALAHRAVGYALGLRAVLAALGRTQQAPRSSGVVGGVAVVAAHKASAVVGAELKDHLWRPGWAGTVSAGTRGASGRFVPGGHSRSSACAATVGARPLRPPRWTCNNPFRSRAGVVARPPPSCRPRSRPGSRARHVCVRALTVSFCTPG